MSANPAGEASGNTGNTAEFLTVSEAAALSRQKVGWVYGHWQELGGRKHGRYLMFHRATLICRLREGIPPKS